MNTSSPRSRVRLFVTGVTIFVAAVTLTGLILSGSPVAERMRRLDSQRVNDLQQISYAVDNYWNVKQSLPTTLEQLQTTQDVYLQSIRDPKTGTPYLYQPKTTDTYELCADFEAATPTDSMTQPSFAARPYTTDSAPGFWNHTAGRACYTLTVHKPTPPLKQ